MIAVINLLDDDGEFEAREGEIEGDSRYVGAGFLCVVVHDFPARVTAGLRWWVPSDFAALLPGPLCPPNRLMLCRDR